MRRCRQTVQLSTSLKKSWQEERNAMGDEGWKRKNEGNVTMSHVGGDGAVEDRREMEDVIGYSRAERKVGC